MSVYKNQNLVAQRKKKKKILTKIEPRSDKAWLGHSLLYRGGRTHDLMSRVRSAIESVGKFSSLELNFLYWLLLRYPFHPHVSVVVKDPCHSAKRARLWAAVFRILPSTKKEPTNDAWSLPSPNEVGIGWLCCSGIFRERIRETSSHATRQGTLYRLQSSQPAELSLTQKSGTGVLGLI